jgi:hypothetical protein
MTSVRRVNSSCLIVAVCTATFPLLGLLFGWTYSLLTQPDPKQLPPVPTSATTILGALAGGFYHADVYVEGVDGNPYRLVSQSAHDEGFWQVDNPDSSVRPGEPCTPRQNRRLTAVAGPLAECQTVRIQGEWCPGPFRSFALTAQGEMWELETSVSCWPVAVPIIGVLAIVGFALGLTSVIIGSLIHKYWR